MKRRKAYSVMPWREKITRGPDPSTLLSLKFENDVSVSRIIVSNASIIYDGFEWNWKAAKTYRAWIIPGM